MFNFILFLLFLSLYLIGAGITIAISVYMVKHYPSANKECEKTWINKLKAILYLIFWPLTLLCAIVVVCCERILKYLQAQTKMEDERE